MLGKENNHNKQTQITKPEKRRICRDERIEGIFAFAESLSTSATLVQPKLIITKFIINSIERRALQIKIDCTPSLKIKIALLILKSKLIALLLLKSKLIALLILKSKLIALLILKSKLIAQAGARPQDFPEQTQALRVSWEL